MPPCLALLGDLLAPVTLVILKRIDQRLQLSLIKCIKHIFFHEGIRKEVHVVVALFKDGRDEVRDHLLWDNPPNM